MKKHRARWASTEQEIIKEVKKIRHSHPRMGARKLLQKLADFFKALGVKIGRDRFFALLKRHDLLILQRRKGRRTTFPGGLRSENLLETAEISAVHQAYVTDITYMETEQGFVYLALVTDLYSRKIVGWDLSRSLSVDGALRAIKRAVSQAKCDVKGLIHHSDHGIQYTSRPYLDYLSAHGIHSSMGRVGNCYDNAVAERVNGILKMEYLLDHRFPDFHLAHLAVKQAVDLYNTGRPHLSLNYQTPEEVYQRSLAA